MSWEAVAAFCAIGLTVLISIIVTTRKLSEIEINLREYFENKQKETNGVLMLEVDRSRTMFGETVRAVRQHSEDAHDRIDKLLIKHQELELYIRDNYVEITSFNTALSRIEKTVDGMDTKIDTLMARNK